MISNDDMERRLQKALRRTSKQADEHILNDAFAAMDQPGWVKGAKSWMWTKRIAAAAVIIIVAVTATIVLTRKPQPPKPEVVEETTPPKETQIAEEQKTPIEQTRQPDRLQQQIKYIAELAEVGDVNALIAMLETDDHLSRLAAASYLAKMDDLRAAEALEKLAAQYAPGDANNIFATAAAAIRAKLEEPPEKFEPDSRAPLKTEPVRRSISGWLADANGVGQPGIFRLGEQESLADESGSFTMAEPTFKNFFSTFGVAFSEDANLGRLVIWNRTEEINEVELVLEPLAGINGRIVNSRVEPVNDFEVSLSPYITDESAYNGYLGPVPWKETVLPDGTFKVNSIPVGLPLQLTIKKPGFKTQLRVEPAAGEKLDFNDITLTPLPGFHDNIHWNCSLFGAVLDESNEPLAGAGLTLVIGEERFETKTDPNGWYEFTNLPNNLETQIIPYFDSYGYNPFGYDRRDCNCHLDIQIFPQAYDWYGKPAPPLLMRDWLNCEPLDLEALKGKIVLLCLGLDPRDGRGIGKIQDIDDRLSDINDVIVIGVHEYIEPNSPKEESLLRFIEEQQIDLPIAIDAHTDLAEDLMLPEMRILQGNKLSFKRRGLKQSGATHSLYEVHQRLAFFLIDKEGVLIGAVPEQELRARIEELLKTN